MLDLRQASRIIIIGGGTAGWFAALTFRRIFSPLTEVLVLEDPNVGIIGVGEGAVLNFLNALKTNNIDIEEFRRNTAATYKTGIAYENWRGEGRNDIYYNLFPRKEEKIEEIEFEALGTMPFLAARVATNKDIHSFLPGFELLAKNANQKEARHAFASGKSGITPSFHFDSHKLATYLKNIAISRGVKNRHVKVQEFLLDEKGFTRALRTEEGNIDVDFVVDSSGLRRIGIGETYQQKWCSFSDQLILDRALPFPIPHPNKNPALYTRAIAMNSGWMWQIPLPERTGAGYAFSSQYTNEEEVVREAEAYLGHSVDARNIIRFEPGHYERVWHKNVVALGLSSGFVEPLEATSIGQMLESLRNVERIFHASRGLIGENAIEAFNLGNKESWNEIRDFLRLHYDTKRQDTKFWQDVKHLPSSKRYQDMKDCMAFRMPRAVDLQNYFVNGWSPLFHMINWVFVGAPLGVLTAEAARAEIASLPKAAQERVVDYIRRISEKPVTSIMQ